VSLYEWLLFLHILAAIIWVGGGIMFEMLLLRVRRTGGGTDLIRLLQAMEWIAPRMIAPSALVLLGLGLTMVAINDAWTIGQLWIVLALVLFGLSFLIGGVYVGPESKRIAAAVEAEGAESPDALRRIGRMSTVSRVDLLLLVVIVWDMVFKPGL
jgi:uncharacterized membrane protein